MSCFDCVPVKGLHSSVSFVWDHSSDGPPQDLGGCSEMIGTSLGVAVHSLSEECEVFELVSVERPGDVQHLASEGNIELVHGGQQLLN